MVDQSFRNWLGKTKLCQPSILDQIKTIPCLVKVDFFSLLLSLWKTKSYSFAPIFFDIECFFARAKFHCNYHSDRARIKIPIVFQFKWTSLCSFSNGRVWDDRMEFRPWGAIKGNMWHLPSAMLPQVGSYMLYCPVTNCQTITGRTLWSLLFNFADRKLEFWVTSIHRSSSPYLHFCKLISSLLAFYAHIVWELNYDSFEVEGVILSLKSANDIVIMRNNLGRQGWASEHFRTEESLLVDSNDIYVVSSALIEISRRLLLFYTTKRDWDSSSDRARQGTYSNLLETLRNYFRSYKRSRMDFHHFVIDEKVTNRAN